MNASCWSVKALAIASGLFWGLYLFLAALFEMFGCQFWWFQTANFTVLTSAYSGLAATWLGAFLGLLQGFICGAICGAIIAFLYNAALKCCAKCCPSSSE